MCFLCSGVRELISGLLTGIAYGCRVHCVHAFCSSRSLCWFCLCFGVWVIVVVELNCEIHIAHYLKIKRLKVKPACVSASTCPLMEWNGNAQGESQMYFFIILLYERDVTTSSNRWGRRLGNPAAVGGGDWRNTWPDVKPNYRLQTSVKEIWRRCMEGKIDAEHTQLYSCHLLKELMRNITVLPPKKLFMWALFFGWWLTREIVCFDHVSFMNGVDLKEGLR